MPNLNLGRILFLALVVLAAAGFSQPLISEIRTDQPGPDDEYFELSGLPSSARAGYTYLVSGDGSGGSGVIEEITTLAGQAMSANGFFVAAESSFTLGTTNLTTDLGFENSETTRV